MGILGGLFHRVRRLDCFVSTQLDPAGGIAAGVGPALWVQRGETVHRGGARMVGRRLESLAAVCLGGDSRHRVDRAPAGPIGTGGSGRSRGRLGHRIRHHLRLPGCRVRCPVGAAQHPGEVWHRRRCESRRPATW